MFYPRRHRWLTSSLVAAYLAANTLGGLLHDHADNGHGGHGHLDGQAHCQHGPSDHKCDQADDPASHDVADATEHSDHGGPLHDDDCAVCRFAGQRVLAVETGPLERLCDLSVELTVVCARQIAATRAPTTHSRAPPPVG
jgi:hypothetical protein